QYADRHPAVARPQGPHRRAKGHGLSRRQALLGACPARAGFRTNRPVVQGRQPHVLRRLHRHTGRLSEAAERTARSLVAPERPMMSAISALRTRSGVDRPQELPVERGWTGVRRRHRPIPAPSAGGPARAAVANSSPMSNRADRLGSPDLIDLFDTPHNRTITWNHLLRQTSDWEGVFHQRL